MGNLSSKQRFYMICVAVVVLSWVAYRFAFARTIDLHSQINQVRKKIEVSEDAPVRLRQMQIRLNELDGMIGHADAQSMSVRVVESIGPFCQANGMVIREIPERHLFQDDQFSIMTCQVEVESNFKNLVRLLNYLEKNSAAGKLRSCVMGTEQDYVTGQRHLTGTYYLQLVNQSGKSDGK